MSMALFAFLRGAAPINHAIFNKDPYTGVTIIKMSEELDAGPILRQEKVMLDHNGNLWVVASSFERTWGKNLLKH